MLGLRRVPILVLLLVVSRHSARSPHVETEVGIASEEKLRIVPVRLEEARLSSELRYLTQRLQFIDLFPEERSEAGFAELLEDLASH